LDVKVNRYRFTIQGRGFEFVLTDRLYGFLVESHPYATHNFDMLWIPIRIYPQIDLYIAGELRLPGSFAELRIDGMNHYWWAH
jgi:hypothetical protein